MHVEISAHLFSYVTLQEMLNHFLNLVLEHVVMQIDKDARGVI